MSICTFNVQLKGRKAQGTICGLLFMILSVVVYKAEISGGVIPFAMGLLINDGTSTNETRLGAVKDIQLAVEKLNLTDDLLVMAGDNVLDFSLSKFVEFAKEKNTSCVMCHEENELKKQQKTAIITLDGNDLITSYEEKPKEPKGNLAVPPFYCYRACDVKRIQEALDNGCGYDAPGSFAAWLSKQTPMHAYVMPGKRYDIGDINSYEYVKSVFSR